jgi:hypothetical protein
MTKTEILTLSVVLVFLAVRLYQKYKKKANSKAGSDKNTSSGPVFSSFSEDDDYEPYTKK